jgi:hypothetical protein
MTKSMVMSQKPAMACRCRGLFSAVRLVFLVTSFAGCSVGTSDSPPVGRSDVPIAKSAAPNVVPARGHDSTVGDNGKDRLAANIQVDLEQVMAAIDAEVVPGATIARIRRNALLRNILKPEFVEEVTDASWLPFRCKPHHRCLIVSLRPPALRDANCIVCIRFEEECSLTDVHESLLGNPDCRELTIDRYAILDPREK